MDVSRQEIEFDEYDHHLAQIKPFSINQKLQKTLIESSLELGPF